MIQRAPGEIEPAFGLRRAPPGEIEPLFAPTPTEVEQAFGTRRRASRRSLRSRLTGGLAALVAALAKFGSALKGIILLAPKLKLLGTLATMLVSVAAYSLLWPWTFAAGFVGLLLIHELGHVIALRREGIRASAPMFIPFLGAAIFSRSLGDNALAEARVGLAGPILGSLGAAALVPLAHLLHSPLLMALAYVGFFLNLINLLPVLPLDGGRAAAALSPALWLVGFAGLIAAALIWHPTPLMLLIVLFGGLETWRRWQQRRHGGPAAQAFYRVSPRNRALVALVYIGLIAALAFGMHATFVQRTL